MTPAQAIELLRSGEPILEWHVESLCKLLESLTEMPEPYGYLNEDGEVVSAPSDDEMNPTEPIYSESQMAAALARSAS